MYSLRFWHRRYRYYLHKCSQWLYGLFNTVVPPTCPGCNVQVTQAHLFCAHCWQQLTFITEPYCHRCGRMLAFTDAELTDDNAVNCCLECQLKPPVYDEARSLLLYEDLAVDLIHNFKYYDHTHLCKCFDRPINALMGDFFRGIDFLIPVPLHPTRLRYRQYNQSALLATALADIFHIPVLYHALTRKINTLPQVTLNGPNRLKNMRGAFRLNPKYQSLLVHKSVILLDDVITTGSTISSCAKILKRHGKVSTVKVFSLARTGYIC